MKNTISLTEYLNGKISCLYFPKREYNGNKKEYDLSDPADRGQYYHRYIENYYKPDADFKPYNTDINADAEDAIKWTNEILPEDAIYHIEETQEKTIKETDLTLIGRPDIFCISDGTLYIIDYKYTSKIETTYNDQIMILAGMITERYEPGIIRRIKSFIKFKNKEPVKREWIRRDLLKIYNEKIESIENYVYFTGYTPCEMCAKCSNGECLHGYRYSVLNIAKQAKTWGGDVLTDEIKQNIAFDDAVLKRYKIDDVLPRETYKKYDPRYSQQLVDILKQKGLDDYIDTKEQVKASTAEELLRNNLITQEEYDTSTTCAKRSLDMTKFYNEQ